MGSTYKPKRKGFKTFDVNSSGRSLLAYIHREYGLPYTKMSDGRTEEYKAEMPYITQEEWDEPCATPSTATKDQCHEWHLKMLHDPRTFLEVAEVLNSAPFKALWGGSTKDLAEWLSDWCSFLDLCEGFERV